VILLVYSMLDFNAILNSWINPYLIDAKGLTYVEAGAVASLGTVAGFVGSMSMGWISL
jgi:sugar phosphate permease